MNRVPTVLPIDETLTLPRFSFNLRNDEITTNESASNQKEMKELVPSKAVNCNLSSDLEGMLTNMAYSDVTIVVAEKEFSAHKNILSGRK